MGAASQRVWCHHSGSAALDLVAANPIGQQPIPSPTAALDSCLAHRSHTLPLLLPHFTLSCYSLVGAAIICLSSFFVAFSMKRRTAHATAEQRWAKSSLRLQQEAAAEGRQQALLAGGESSDGEEEGEGWEEPEPAGSKERGPGISSIGSTGSLLGGSPGTPSLADAGVAPAPPAQDAPREP